MEFGTKTRLAATLRRFWGYGLGQASGIAGKALQTSANGISEIFQTPFSALQPAQSQQKNFGSLALGLLSRVGAHVGRQAGAYVYAGVCVSVGVHSGAPKHMWERVHTHIREQMCRHDYQAARAGKGRQEYV